MKAAILTIGDEILMGQITDTNSVYIARHLSESGIETCRMQSVPDQSDAIRQALDGLLAEADLLSSSSPEVSAPPKTTSPKKSSAIISTTNWFLTTKPSAILKASWPTAKPR